MKTKIIIAAILVAGYILFLLPNISITTTNDETVSKPASTAYQQDDIPAASDKIAPGSTLFNFGGEWRGVLQPIHGPHLDPRDWNLELRFFIKGKTAQVFIRRGNSWQEVKPGKFKFSQEKSNAFIYSSDSGKGWAESWVFSLSRRDADSIFVYGNRIINNFKQPASKEGARITYGATSVFQRSYDRFSENKVTGNKPLTETEIARQFKEAIERGKRFENGKKYGKFTFREHRILENHPDSIVLGVNYIYEGLDEDRVWMGAITLIDGETNSNWSYRPSKVKRGYESAKIRVSMNSKSPDKYCSDSLRFQVYVGGEGSFFEKDIPFEKCWERQH